MTTAVSGDGGAGSSLGPDVPQGLLDGLTGTLDAMIDGPLAGAGLFGAPPPTVGGRFHVERRLGEGATSVVYAARDTTLDRLVALKIIARRDADGAWRERVLREARALASLRNSHVVEVYDVGEWCSHPFIAMELVTGMTLAAWQTARHHPWQEIVRRYLAAGRGLEAAHAAGLVHRDFKPANVLVDGDRVAVTDFGLAISTKPPEEAAGARSPVGTPAYRAPEQRAGAPPRPAADVFSFCVALCEALIGRHPLIDLGSDEAAGAEAAAGGPQRPRPTTGQRELAHPGATDRTVEPTPSTHRALAPAALHRDGFDWRQALTRTPLPRRAREAIERGMATDPALRDPRLGPLLAELERALPGPPRRLQTARRRRATSALLALGAGLAAVGDRPRPPTPAGDTSAHVEIARALRREDPTAGLALLREVPPDQRDASWAEVARALLLRPIAREVRCFGGASIAPARASAGHGLIAAIDDGGRASVCDLATRRAAPLTDGAICARVLDRERVGVITAGGELAVFVARGPSWQLARRLPVVPLAASPERTLSCHDDLWLLGPGGLALRDADGRWRLADLGDGPAPPAVAATIDEVIDEVIATQHGRLTFDLAGGVVVRIEAEAGEVLDLETGHVRRHDALGPGYVRLLALVPGGHLAVAAVGSGQLLWWPLQGAHPPRLEVVSDSALVQLEPSPSGARLLWRSSTHSVGVRDVGSAAEHELPSGGRSVCHATFVTDDRVAAVTCEGRVLEWDLAAERSVIAGRHELAHCRPDCSPATSSLWMAATTPDGSVIASAGREGTVGLWPTGPGGEAARLPLGPGRRAFQIVVADDLLLVTTRDATAELWDWRAHVRVAELRGHEVWSYAAAVARTPSGAVRYVTGSRGSPGSPGMVRFWREDGLLLSADPVGASVEVLATSPDGALVAAATWQGNVMIYDAQSGARRASVRAHRSWARCIVFLDERVLLSAGDDGRLVAIAAGSGQILAALQAHDDKIYDLDLDRRTGRLLTASHDGTVRLWELRRRALVRTYVGHRLPVHTVRWHPDGTRFISGDGDVDELGHSEGAACVWRVDHDTCEDWLLGHRDAVRSAQFLGDGRAMTASLDGTVRIWRPLPPMTAAELAAEIDRRAPACLDERQLMAYLHEPAAAAAARAAACRAAAP